MSEKVKKDSAPKKVSPKVEKTVTPKVIEESANPSIEQFMNMEGGVKAEDVVSPVSKPNDIVDYTKKPNGPIFDQPKINEATVPMNHYDNNLESGINEFIVSGDYEEPVYQQPNPQQRLNPNVRQQLPPIQQQYYDPNYQYQPQPRRRIVQESYQQTSPTFRGRTLIERFKEFMAMEKNINPGFSIEDIYDVCNYIEEEEMLMSKYTKYTAPQQGYGIPQQQLRQAEPRYEDQYDPYEQGLNYFGDNY